MIGFPKNFTDFSEYARHKRGLFPLTKEAGLILARQAELAGKRGLPDRKTEGWRHFPFQKVLKGGFTFPEFSGEAVDFPSPSEGLAKKTEDFSSSSTGLSKQKADTASPSVALSGGTAGTSSSSAGLSKGKGAVPPPSADPSKKTANFPPAVFPDSLVLKVQNGRLKNPGRLPPGLSVFKWEDVLKGTARLPEDVKNFVFLSMKKERGRLCSLNGALAFSGLVIVADGRIRKTIEIQYLYPPGLPGGRAKKTADNLRNFVFLRDKAEVLVAEVFCGAGLFSEDSSVLLNLQTEGFIGKSARGDFIRLDQGGERDIWFNHLFCEMAKESEGRFFTLNLGSGVSRQSARLFQREKSVSDIRGLSLLSGGRHGEHDVRVSHLEEGGESRQFYQSLLFQRAKHVFRGRINIEKPAQRTSAHQLSRNLILGERAAAVSAPELDIKADDVKAHHGAVVSPFEESRALLFYLQSRGIGAPEALNLILTALMKETFSTLHPAAKAPLETLSQSHLKNIKGPAAGLPY